MQLSGILVRSYTWIPETFNDPLGRSFKERLCKYSSTDPRAILRIAIRAKNFTIEKNGLEPSRLVSTVLSKSYVRL